MSEGGVVKTETSVMLGGRLVGIVMPWLSSLATLWGGWKTEE